MAGLGVVDLGAGALRWWLRLGLWFLCRVDRTSDPPTASARHTARRRRDVVDDLTARLREKDRLLVGSVELVVLQLRTLEAVLIWHGSTSPSGPCPALIGRSA